MKNVSGIIAAPFTPFDKNGKLDTGIVPEYYRFLEKNGVAGAFINGSTGECASMTQKEKHQNAEKWAESLKNGGRIFIINLVGGTSYNECIENAIHSREIGLSAIAVVAPYYFKPASCLQLAEFVTRIGESVPDLPVYFYHIPSLTGVNMPMIGFLEKISGMLPNFAGIKYTNEDFMDFLTCLNFMNRKYDMFWGRDECMLSALVLGTNGFVGSTYNYAAPLYIRLIEAFRRNDLNGAVKMQQLSINMISLLGKYGGMGTGKAFMKYIGIDCGEFRSPVKNMTGEMFIEFVKDVRALGMDNLFSKK
jgi:N-acetylneuraminate lyase